MLPLLLVLWPLCVGTWADTYIGDADGYYLLFDCPGQVELFTLHESLQNIVQVLTGKWHIR